jgi:putative hydrolase of the HAD superfamily
VIVRQPAILFDLWGTLVPAFPRTEHEKAIAACARILDLDPDRTHAGWVDTFPGRIRGQFPTLESNFEFIAGQSGARLDDDSLAEAAREYRSWTSRHLECSPAVLASLAALRQAGHRLGLVTNCAPDVPAVVGSSPLRARFDTCSYSCQLGAVKPEPSIYLTTLDRLGARPQEALFVGDGSDNELSGARSAGITAVLLDADLSDTYDQVRPDHQRWDGPRVVSVTELRSGLGDAGTEP